MMQYLWMDLLIYLSVSICVIAALLSAYIIYRRDSNSPEHKYFAIFFLGFAGMVGFYLFLQDPVLKDFSYAFQLVSMSAAVFGLALFYYALAHEGQVSFKVVLFSLVSIFLIPIICIIFRPYVFIEELYGYELVIEAWFLTTVIVVYVAFTLYALIGLIWLHMKTANGSIKRRLKRIYLGLGFDLIIALIFLGIIPIFLDIHYLKPIGYIGLAFGTFIMVSAFKGENA